MTRLETTTAVGWRESKRSHTSTAPAGGACGSREPLDPLPPTREQSRPEAAGVTIAQNPARKTFGEREQLVHTNALARSSAIAIAHELRICTRNVEASLFFYHSLSPKQKYEADEGRSGLEPPGPSTPEN